MLPVLRARPKCCFSPWNLKYRLYWGHLPKLLELWTSMPRSTITTINVDFAQKLWTCRIFYSPQIWLKLWTFCPDPQYNRLLWTCPKLCGNACRTPICSRTPPILVFKRRFTRNCVSRLPRGVYWIRSNFGCLCRGSPYKGTQIVDLTQTSTKHAYGRGGGLELPECSGGVRNPPAEA
jgi:hypothetical protein